MRILLYPCILRVQLVEVVLLFADKDYKENLHPFKMTNIIESYNIFFWGHGASGAMTPSPA